MGLEVREVAGIFISGIIFLAIVATIVQPNSKMADVAKAFTDGFANDVRAATFQGSGSSSG